MEKHFDMTGRTVLVTGASSGLGRRFARVLVNSGAKVAVAARRTDRLHELVVEIAAAGGEALPIAMDVQDEASVIAGFDAAEDALGPIDSVIANAGMNSEGLAPGRGDLHHQLMQPIGAAGGDGDPGA